MMASRDIGRGRIGPDGPVFGENTMDRLPLELAQMSKADITATANSNPGRNLHALIKKDSEFWVLRYKERKRLKLLRMNYSMF